MAGRQRNNRLYEIAFEITKYRTESLTILTNSHRELRVIKRLLLVCTPATLYLLASTAVLFLLFMDIKYTYEPALTGTQLDYLVDETYTMVWLFYGALNITFVVIYAVFLLVFKRLSRKN